MITLAETLRTVVLQQTGGTRHLVDGVEQAAIAGLRIAKYGDDAGVYLLYLNATGEEVTDTLHSSIEAALAQASFEFGINSDAWRFEPVAGAPDGVRGGGAEAGGDLAGRERGVKPAPTFEQGAAVTDWASDGSFPDADGKLVLVGDPVLFERDLVFQDAELQFHTIPAGSFAQVNCFSRRGRIVAISTSTVHSSFVSGYENKSYLRRARPNDRPA